MLHNCTFEKACSTWMTLKATHCHRNNNDSTILHHLPVTYLEMSFRFEKTDEISSHMCFMIHVWAYYSQYTLYFWNMRVRKVLNSKVTLKPFKGIEYDAIWYSTYHFPLVSHCNYVSISHRLWDCITYFPKFKEVTSSGTCHLIDDMQQFFWLLK